MSTESKGFVMHSSQVIDANTSNIYDANNSNIYDAKFIRNNTQLVKLEASLLKKNKY